MRPRTLVITAVVLLALLTLAIGVRALRSDSRSYPGNSGVSLNDGLKWANLKLPQCAENFVRYAWYSDVLGMAKKLALRLSGDRPCLDEFLSVNHFAGGTYAAGAAFVSTAPGNFGWPTDPEKNFTIIKVDYSTTAPLQVQIAGDFQNTPPDLFVVVGNV